MDKQLKKLIVPGAILASIVIFVGILFATINPMIEEYNQSKSQQEAKAQEEKQLEEEVKKKEEEETKEAMRLKAIKPIYQSDLSSSAENLGIFGNMFEDIIKRVQYNGLAIRSIEYDLKPASDLFYQKFSEDYNVCELKFFLVGTYTQLQSFLVELNNTFPYFISISKLEASAFIGNTDYILVILSVDLYSKKIAEKK